MREATDFTSTEPYTNDQAYWEFDPGPEAAEKAGGRNFSVPKGWYPMVVAKFDKTTSQAGNPMFVIEFTCAEGVAKNRYNYKMYQSITEKSRAPIARLLSALGCEKTSTGSYKIEPALFLGTKVDVFLEPEEYEGTTRSKPKYIRTVDTSGKGEF